jgi:hypothetical protein
MKQPAASGAIIASTTLSAEFMHIVVAIAFLLILSSLGSALFFMMKDRGRSNRMVYSLMLRVGFSIALFLFILFAHWMGWIQSTGIRFGS